MNAQELKRRMNRLARFGMACRTQLEQLHLDANETFFLERELLAIRSRTFTVEYQPAIARSFVPKATDIPDWADVYTYKIYDRVGKAKLITYKDKAIPRVDVIGRDQTGRVHPIGASYGWDIDELRKAAANNLPLADEKTKTAREVVEYGMDDMLSLGVIADPETGALPDVQTTGLLNNADVIALGIVAGTFWVQASGAPPGGGAVDPTIILAQLGTLSVAVSTATKNRHEADTLLLPTMHYNYLEQTPYSALTGNSLLEQFRKNNSRIKTIAPWHKLDTAGVGGVARAIAYKKSSDILEGIIPQEFEVMPPQWQGFDLVHNCHAKSGGVKVLRPFGMKYMDLPLA